MKRFLFLICFLCAVSVQAQISSNFREIGRAETFIRVDNTSVAADSGKVEAKSNPPFVGKLSKDWTWLGFSLFVATRGANDSLLVTFQTTANPEDTLTFPWVTLTNFGRKAAVATTQFRFPTNVAARDSIAVPASYFRVMEDHSIDAWTAADTSSWVLTLIQGKN